MISASAAEAHRFGRVRRNGYDPAEVDAAMTRLVETLRSHEERMASLEDRLAEADASADAIRRTFVAAEKTRDEILDSARTQAQSMTDGARSEAEEILAAARATAAETTDRARSEVAQLEDLASNLDADMAATRERVIAEAEHEAQRLLGEAEADASQRTLAAEEAARAIAASNADEELARRRRAQLASHAMSMATARIRREAMAEGQRIVENARGEAATLLVEAEQDRAALTERIAALRGAIGTLEASATQLAAIAGSQASVVDLNAIEAIEAEESRLSDVDLATIERAEAHLQSIPPMPHDDHATSTDSDTEGAVATMTETAHDDAPHMDVAHADEPITAAPAAVVATERIDDAVEDEPIETTPESTDPIAPSVVADGGPLREPPPLTVAEATDAIALEDSDEIADDAGSDEPEPEDQGPQTYYQKSTGIPLSERVKLARRSG